MDRRCFAGVNGCRQIPAKPAPSPPNLEAGHRSDILADILSISAWGGVVQKASRREVVVGFGLPLSVLLLGSWCGRAMAQKLVDPNSVAPEFRDAAVKRRNEQIKLAICAKKAEEAKVLRRDRAEFVDKCMVR
jgi:hypothetical protein